MAGEEEEEDAFQELEGMEMGVAEFITHWSLREEAQQLLYSFDPVMQLKVIQQFAPRDTTRDVNAIFCKFARGVAGGVTGGVPRVEPVATFVSADPWFATAEVGAFAATWGLNAESQEFLSSMEPDARERVMKEFRPRDTSSDANNIFMKFAQGVLRGPAQRYPAWRQAQAPLVEPLHAPHQGKLVPPPPKQQAAIRVPPNLAQVHALFPPRASRAAGKTPSRPAINVTNFVVHWCLQAEAKAILNSLDPEVQQKVMSEFAPKDTSRDVNAIFCKFAQGVAAHVPQSNKGIRPTAAQYVPPVSSTREQELWQEPRDGVAEGGGGTSTGSVEVDIFVQAWQLGEEAQTMLLGLSPEVQDKVMQEFAPRDPSTDVNNIFMKFAQGVSTGVRRAPGAAKGLVDVAFEGVIEMPTSELQEFAEQWRLGIEAQKLLAGLTSFTQARVMEEFAPKDAERDVNNIFIKFANGVSKGVGKFGKGKGKGKAPTRAVPY